MDEQPQKKRMGRPPGKVYENTKSLKLAKRDNKLLKKLADRWGCSEAAAMRRAIRESAKREKLEAEDEQP